jgi:uncharacterized protein
VARASVAGRSLPAVGSVQVVQALVARELVEGDGLPERHVARLLGIGPSAISQYLTGKRLGPLLSEHLVDPEARRIARQIAHRLTHGEAGPRVLLEGAIALSERPRGVPGSGGDRERGGLSVELQRKVPGWLRNRIAGEQNAVVECMRLAQRSQDELTRALFRQIASDSLRHAEIVASLSAQLDRGLVTSPPTGIDRADVERLIRREHEAEATSEIDLGPELGGMMRILWESMESDEKKHDRLLQLLLALPFSAEGAAAPPTPARRPPRRAARVRNRG